MFKKFPVIENLKSRNAYRIVTPVFFLFSIIGFLSPGFLGFLTFADDAKTRVLANLLTGFIAIPSTVLAISAILFAILQVSNRRITIIQMVFQNSYVIPLVYWAILNIIGIIVLQLGLDTFEPYHILRLEVCLSYNLILLLAGLLVTLYNCFRYLDYSNITDDYIVDIYRMLSKEKDKDKANFDGQQLRQRAKEVYAEIMDAIKKDDVVLVRKYLETFEGTLIINPSSNFLGEFNKNLARWSLTALRNRNGDIFGGVIEFWRRHMIYWIDGKINFAFNNIDRVPLLAYQFAENDPERKKAITEAYSLRLKEIGQRYIYAAEKDKHFPSDTTFDRLIIVYSEFSELIKYLILKDDLATLRLVVNDVTSLRESFKRDSFRSVAGQMTRNRIQRQLPETGIDAEDYATYQISKKAVDDVNLILLGNLYWAILQLSNHNLVLQNRHHLKEILAFLDQRLDYNEAISSIVHVFNNEDPRFGWEDWIWRGEERLTNQVYTISGVLDMFGVGFVYTLLKHPQLNIGRHLVDDLEELRHLMNRCKEIIRRIPAEPAIWPELLGITADQLGELVLREIERIDRVGEYIEEDHIRRLIETPVSDRKISDFKKMMTDQWDTSRDLSKIFEYFNAVEINPEKMLVDAGPNVNFTKGKVMFVEGDEYQYVYGLDWGKDVNRGIEDRFAELIAKEAKESKEKNIVNVLDNGIKAIQEKKHKPNLILIHSGLLFASELSLAGSGKYSSINNHNNPFPFYIAGFYNNETPIVSLIGSGFKGLVIIASLPAGLSMQQRQNKAYENKNLIVEISGISHQKAEEMRAERIAKNQAPQTLDELQASMLVHVHQIFDFSVGDETALKVYRLPLDL